MVYDYKSQFCKNVAIKLELIGYLYYLGNLNLPVYKRPKRFLTVSALKSGSMTVSVLHSQGSSGGKRFRRKALGPPRTICKIEQNN